MSTVRVPCASFTIVVVVAVADGGRLLSSEVRMASEDRVGGWAEEGCRDVQKPCLGYCVQTGTGKVYMS